ncbi:MAG: DNRLRE domain-containing protein [Crocinitomicaceae bacterium]|nr:DNRLRE domain-containing protein [Crocinitomicaceae bacterium]
MKKLYATILFVSFTVMSIAQSVTLNPTKDNSIYVENPFNSAGQGRLYAGPNSSAFRRRALMQFDFSSIPAGSTILTAELTVNVDQYSGGVTSFYSLYPLTTAFGEGASAGGVAGSAAIAPDATWNDAMYGTSAWSTIGGDYVASPMAFSNMSNTTGNQVFATGASFVSVVQAWYDTPATNFGLIMIGDEGSSGTVRRFGSKEVGTAPVLVVTYSPPPCTTPPTAICQSHTVYLDGLGNATITGADLDGGSIDNCGTAGLSFTASQTTFTCADVALGGGGAPIMISGLYDGPLPGGHPKGIELLVTSAISDLSNFGVGSANNGGGTDGEEFTFPAAAASAGTYIYVTSDSAGFNNFFGFNADYVSNSMLINGDDAVELFQGGAVIDVFGDINTDGTGQPWEYLDGWAYRNNLQTPNGGTFTSTNWIYSGINVFDGETTNGTAATPIALGTFMAGSASATPVTLVVTDGSLNQDSCVAQVIVMDTLGPVPDVAALAPVADACFILSLPVQTATDNCDGSLTGTNDAAFPINSQGTTIVTWTYTDSYGNVTTQTQDVIINDAVVPVPDTTSLADLTGSCEVAAPTAPTATDACAGNLTGTPDVSFPITTPGTTVVTWTYDDGHGNIATQTQNVIISGIDVSTSETGGVLTAAASGVSYQWIDCSDSSAIAGETNQAFEPTVTGDYAVIITDGSCSDTSACANVVTNSLVDTGLDLGISIAPNPSSGKFVVNFASVVDGEIKIFDSKGAHVRSILLNQAKQIEINLQEFGNGLYIMKTLTAEGIAITRLVKQ